jgi:hypothetical protein
VALVPSATPFLRADQGDDGRTGRFKIRIMKQLTIASNTQE